MTEQCGHKSPNLDADFWCGLSAGHAGGHGEWVEYNTNDTSGHSTLSPFCIYWHKELMYRGAWCEICEGEIPK